MVYQKFGYVRYDLMSERLDYLFTSFDVVNDTYFMDLLIKN